MNSIPYLFFVFINVLLMLYGILIKTDKNNLIFIKIVCLSTCVLFFGFRGFIGWDWYNYYVLFNDVPKIYSNELIPYFGNTLMEPAFILYCSVLKLFSDSYHILTLVNCIIDLIFLNWFLKKYLPLKYYAFGFILYFIFGGFYFETDLLRNSRSFFIFLLTIKYIEERKILHYYFFNSIGILFHLSSIIYLFVYKVLNLNIKRYVFIFIFIIGNILFVFNIQYVKPLIEFASSIIGGKLSYLVNVYFIDDAKSYGLSIGFIERNIMALLVIFYFNEIKNYNKTYNIFINSYFIYFILFFFFSEVSVLSTRFGLLFYYSYWILLPIIFDIMKPKITKLIFIIGIVSFFFLKMYGMTKADNYLYENTLVNESDYYKKKEVFEFFLNSNGDQKN